MQITVNSVGEIISYVKVGTIEGAIEFGGTIPDDFESQFKPSFFILENDVIVINPDYKNPEIGEPDKVPTQTDKTIAQLMLQQAQQKLSQDKFNAQLLLEVAQIKGEE